MKRIFLTAALALGLGPAMAAGERLTAHPTSMLEQVEEITAFNRLDNWRAIDASTLIVWKTPAQAYLLELDRASTDLPFVQTIGVTSVGSQIRANIDSIEVRGRSYLIKQIFKLDREQARTWGRV